MAPSRQIATAAAAIGLPHTVRATDAVHCLVVATDEARRDNLGFAAREGGWEVTLCSDSATAVVEARKRLLQMAIVDMSTPPANGVPGFQFLVEELACTSRMLLLVCGKLDDTGQEVWARHLGVWMYLPGAVDGTELVGLCTAARETVERLAAPQRQRALERKNYRSS